jgi:hypothetical protein
LSVALAVSAVIIAFAFATAALPLLWQGLLILGMWAGVLWVALRFGLAESDKSALGRAARRLHL